jgi:hypothetical protein
MTAYFDVTWEGPEIGGDGRATGPVKGTQPDYAAKDHCLLTTP